MTIFLIRHAIALDRDLAAVLNLSDSQRGLTRKGIKKFNKNVKLHKKKFKKIDLFISSPFLRAKETLDLVLKLNTVKKPKIKLYKLIRPEDKPTYFVKWLKNSKCKKIVVVSHEPYITELLHLIFKNEWKPTKIHKGQIIKLKISDIKKSYKLLI